MIVKTIQGIEFHEVDKKEAVFSAKSKEIAMDQMSKWGLALKHSGFELGVELIVKKSNGDEVGMCDKTAIGRGEYHYYFFINVEYFFAG